MCYASVTLFELILVSVKYNFFVTDGFEIYYACHINFDVPTAVKAMYRNKYIQKVT